jgi:hypothetical protein
MKSCHEQAAVSKINMRILDEIITTICFNFIENFSWSNIVYFRWARKEC